MAQNTKKPVWQILKDTKINPKSYAMIIVDGDDAVFMFNGEGDILLELIPDLEKNIKAKMEADKVH